MAKDEQIVTVEKLRDELVKTMIKVRNGEITPTKGNSIANIIRTALYAEQIRYQQEKGQEIALEGGGVMELSQEDKDRLDGLAKLLTSEKGKKK